MATPAKDKIKEKIKTLFLPNSSGNIDAYDMQKFIDAIFDTKQNLIHTTSKYKKFDYSTLREGDFLVITGEKQGIYQSPMNKPKFHDLVCVSDSTDQEEILDVLYSGLDGQVLTSVNGEPVWTENFQVKILGTAKTQDILNSYAQEGDIWICEDSQKTKPTTEIGDGLAFRNGEFRNIGQLRGTRGLQGKNSKVPGPAGPAGTPGPAGTTGQQGIQGIQGTPGLQGKPGHQGPQGNPGIQGPKGKDSTVAGPKGPQGPTGTPGVSGQPGPAGGQGLQGARGPQGTQGTQGPVGNTGTQGPAGVGINIQPPVANIAARNALSTTWDASHDGHAVFVIGDGNFYVYKDSHNPKWINSAHLQGVQGIQGIPGPQGPTGIQGKAGTGVTIQGTKNIADIIQTQAKNGDLYIAADTDTTTTPQGTKGDGFLYNGKNWINVGAIKGQDGQDGQDGKDGKDGSVGKDGPAGQQGPKGDQGIPGPKGDTGTPGAQGPAGAVGPTGLQGAKGPNGTNGTNGVDGKSAYELAKAADPTNPDLADKATWIASLKGEKGDKGDTGLSGTQGPKGDKGDAGKNGTGVTIIGSDTLANIQKKNGKAGDMWLDKANGHGIVSDGNGAGAAHWTDVGEIKGPKGDKGVDGADGAKGADSTVPGPAGTAGKPGGKGDPGQNGTDGHDGAPGPKGDIGKSAYQEAIDKGFVGTEAAWIKSLKGTNGTNGAAGTPGLKGDKGDTGPKGATGAKGDTGLTGATGATGAAGAAGAQGIQGIAGPVGPQGATGAAGAKGPKGDTGAAGPRGPIGPDGHKGDKGADSTVAGPTGPQGTQGPKGDAGKDGSGVTIQGSDTIANIKAIVSPAAKKGDMWLATDSGTDDNNGAIKPGDGVVYTGQTTKWKGVGPMKGPKGDTGAQGGKGDKGDTGAAGTKGDKGDTGPAGPQGTAGAKGAKGDPGTPGAQGPAGAQGQPGNDGQDSQVAGPAGPKGEKGNDGTQGPKGDPGAPGAKGAKGDTGLTGPAGQGMNLDPDNPEMVLPMSGTATSKTASMLVKYKGTSVAEMSYLKDSNKFQFTLSKTDGTVEQTFSIEGTGATLGGHGVLTRDDVTRNKTDINDPSLSNKVTRSVDVYNWGKDNYLPSKGHAVVTGVGTDPADRGEFKAVSPNGQNYVNMYAKNSGSISFGSNVGSFFNFSQGGDIYAGPSKSGHLKIKNPQGHYETAATQEWVTPQLATYLPLSGGTITGKLEVKAANDQISTRNLNGERAIFGMTTTNDAAIWSTKAKCGAVITHDGRFTFKDKNIVTGHLSGTTLELTI